MLINASCFKQITTVRGAVVFLIIIVIITLTTIQYNFQFCQNFQDYYRSSLNQGTIINVSGSNKHPEATTLHTKEITHSSNENLASTTNVVAGVSKQTEATTLSANDITKLSKDFIVSTAKCQIPDMDPHHASIMPFIEPAAPLECSKHPPLTYTMKEEGRDVLMVNETVVNKYEVKSLDELDCCFSVITRSSENRNTDSSCNNFHRKAVLDISVQFVYVECRDNATQTEVYSNVHAVVQKITTEDSVESVTKQDHTATSSTNQDEVNKSPKEEFTTKSTSFNGTPSDKPKHQFNILILGIDSVSRLNFMRTMPKTVAHLNDNDWLEFRGYNKVGDNTVPNVFAILVGQSLKQIQRTKCFPAKDVDIDNCPFIWNEFHDKGYFTAYAEDEPWLATFNYNNGGFGKQPVDYYARPLAVEAIQRLNNVKRDDLVFCMGPTSTADHFLKLTLDLVTTHTKLFALVWFNHFSHNNYNTPAAVDGKFLQFMEKLKASGALNNTIIFFLSDHGARYGKIRETYVGWMEERLPFFFMWLPELFRESYPKAYNNLKAHRDMLTSPYDVHLALKEIVEEKVGESEVGCKGCPKCRSLFTPPVEDRDCEDAGITPNWCTCASQTQASTSSEVVLNATKFAVNKINQKLNASGNETMSKCAILELKSVFSARLLETEGGFNDYVIVFYTIPGMALFDATVRFHRKRDFEIVGMISRINSYHNDSKCMTEKELKLYCYCFKQS